MQVDAPFNDLIFIHKVVIYRNVESLVSTRVLTTFSTHLWYLTGECVPISLFSTVTLSAVKKKRIETLLKPQLVDYVMPKGRFVVGDSLQSLIGEDSHFLFKLFKGLLICH